MKISWTLPKDPALVWADCLENHTEYFPHSTVCVFEESLPWDLWCVEIFLDPFSVEDVSVEPVLMEPVPMPHPPSSDVLKGATVLKNSPSCPFPLLDTLTPCAFDSKSKDPAHASWTKPQLLKAATCFMETHLLPKCPFPLPAGTITLLPPLNWVKENQKDLCPITVGSFYIHGHHDNASPEPGLISLQVDAASAFGSGYHETTQGCLRLIERVHQECLGWNKALDLGCGTGILALAMEKKVPCPTWGADNDKESVDVACMNGKINGSHHCRFVLSHGFEHDELHQPFDLVVANILLDPLQSLCADITRYAVKNLILSGITTLQILPLKEIYGREGWHVRQEILLKDWAALWLSRIP